MANNTEDVGLRTHNEYDSIFTSALMNQHPEWDMETVREAALICSNTMKPLIQQEANRQKLELLDRLERGAWSSYMSGGDPVILPRDIEAQRKQLEQARKKVKNDK